MSSVDVIFVTFISKYTLVWSEIKVSQITETDFEDASFTLILSGGYGSENKDNESPKWLIDIQNRSDYILAI